MSNCQSKSTVLSHLGFTFVSLVINTVQPIRTSDQMLPDTLRSSVLPLLTFAYLWSNMNTTERWWSEGSICTVCCSKSANIKVYSFRLSLGLFFRRIHMKKSSNWGKINSSLLYIKMPGCDNIFLHDYWTQTFWMGNCFTITLPKRSSPYFL